MGKCCVENVTGVNPISDKYGVVTNYSSSLVELNQIKQFFTFHLIHYSGGTVVFKYLDHRDGKHKTKTLTQEEMILRYVSHIPQHHFKMVRYYGFLSNRKRGCLLPLVYLALGEKAPKQPELLTYAKQYKGFTGNDPYKSVLCEAEWCLHVLQRAQKIMSCWIVAG